MLGWLIDKHGIEPHVTVFDKSARKDGTFALEDVNYDPVGELYYLSWRQVADHNRDTCERWRDVALSSEQG